MRKLEHTMADLDDSAKANLTLGTKGQKFSFDDYTSPITFGSVSAKAGEMTDVTSFINGL